MSGILVTGATGFVGRHLVARLAEQGHRPRCAVRSIPRAREILGATAAELVEVAPLGSGTDWNDALRGVQTVLHLAARAHILEEKAADPLAAFLEVNTAGTLRLAEAASRHGVVNPPAPHRSPRRRYRRPWIRTVFPSCAPNRV